MTRQLPFVKPKRRFHAAAVMNNPGLGLNPTISGGDYIVNEIHKDVDTANRSEGEYYFGNSKALSERRNWWLTEIQLTYDGPNPSNPDDGRVHYLFRALPPNSFDYSLMKKYANFILEELYRRLGRGVGKVFFSTIPGDKIQKYLQDERIIRLDYEAGAKFNFNDWTINFVGDELHYVDPDTIDLG